MAPTNPSQHDTTTTTIMIHDQHQQNQSHQPPPTQNFQLPLGKKLEMTNKMDIQG